MIKKVIVEFYKTPNCFNAYAPNFPGCFSTGETLAEARKNIIEALEDYIPDYIRGGGIMPDDLHDYDVVAVRLPSDVADHPINGDTLRAFRTGRGLTQAQLAEKLDVAPESISEWERGRRELPGTVKYLLESLA